MQWLKHLSMRSIAVLLCVLTSSQMSIAAEVPTAPSAKQAQQPTPEANATNTPEQRAQDRMIAAHTVYIADDGADEYFPVNPSYGRDRLVASMQAWGRYRIVPTIKDADIVIQLRSAVATSVVDGTTEIPSSSVVHSPYFRVTIADPSTLQPLWTVTVPVRTGTRDKGRVDLFAQSAQNVVSHLKQLVGEPLTTQELAAMRQPLLHNHKVLAFVAIGVFVAASVGGAIAYVHFKNNADQNQKNFCIQNNIPNCPA